MKIYSTKQDLWLSTDFNKLLPAGSMILVIEKMRVTIPKDVHRIMYIIVGPAGMDRLLFDSHYAGLDDPLKSFVNSI